MAKKKLFELQMEADALKAEYNEIASSLTMKEVDEWTAKIIAANQAISDCITDGAKDCADGTRPLGMERRPGLYEIGDPNVEGCRAQGKTPDEAVYRWNNDDYYVKPTADSDATLTYADANASKKKDKGEVIVTEA